MYEEMEFYVYIDDVGNQELVTGAWRMPNARPSYWHRSGNQAQTDAQKQLVVCSNVLRNS